MAHDLFRDYDDKAVFDEFEREAGSEKCQNFVVEFGADSARVARDLGRMISGQYWMPGRPQATAILSDGCR